ncbi:MAG TPA: uracil-DNA glycosylase [Ramlibacter sp.]|nr:uracil-DNA glycosylase [Ramlibacter sp.]
MSLRLDDRQRAMLAEMGVRLFDGMPSEADAPAQASAPVAAAPQARAPEPMAAPARAAPEPLAESSALAPPSPAPADLPQGADLRALADAAATCQACGLCQGRRNAVFGSGDPQADWLIVGDAPTEEEDLLGQPFAGAPGQLLDNMLRALGLARDRGVYLTNALKCRSPANRSPAPDEVAQCERFLRAQVAAIKPRVILAMGRFAVQALLNTQDPPGRLRGRAHAYQGIPVVVTFHPGYLLRNLPDKAHAWSDLCLAQDLARSTTTQA